MVTEAAAAAAAAAGVGAAAILMPLLVMLLLAAAAWGGAVLFRLLYYRQRVVRLALAPGGGAPGGPVFVDDTLVVTGAAPRRLASEVLVLVRRAGGGDGGMHNRMGGGGGGAPWATLETHAPGPAAGGDEIRATFGPFVTPGEYGVRYLRSAADGAALAEAATVVSAPSLEVVADPSRGGAGAAAGCAGDGGLEEVPWGAPLFVRFVTSPSHAPGDAVALRRLGEGSGGGDTARAPPTRLPRGAGTGVLELKAPGMPGAYELEYASERQGGIVTGRSRRLRVAPPTLSLEREVQYWAEPVRVTFTVYEGHAKSDYVTLVHVAGPDGGAPRGARREGPYRYVTEGGAGAVVFDGRDVPKELGTYVAQYVSGASRAAVAVSARLTVAGPTITPQHASVPGRGGSGVSFGEPVVLTLTVSPCRGTYDRVCLSRRGERPGAGSTTGCTAWVPMPSAAADGAANSRAEVVLAGDAAPKLPGTYAVHYFVDNEEAQCVVSAPFEVAGPSLAVQHAGEPFWREPVGVRFETSPVHGGDVVALAPAGGPAEVKFGPALLGYPSGRFVAVRAVARRAGCWHACACW